MREELSIGTMDPLLLARTTSPPQTPAASSVGASSPAVPINIGAVDWLGHGGSKAGSFSGAGSFSHPPRTSLSTSASESALGSSQPSCRPWERGDLLRRLATFKPSNWSGKPKVASSLACARRGWVNINIDKLACEACGVHLDFAVLASGTPSEVDSVGDASAKQLDASHKATCPWKGNSCAESLVQFPPTPPSALIGGYKDRCDGLLQFLSLPVIASSAIEQMRLSRSMQIDRLLSQSHVFSSVELGFRADSMPSAESSREESWHIYSQAQRLISLCGWEPRWLPNVQDCEEHSAQSARNACSIGPSQDRFRPSHDPGPSKNAFSASAKKDTGKKKVFMLESRCDSRSALLDCSLCGATVRLWDFLMVPRPARFSPNGIDIPETSKKLGLTRGVSAASGINGWVAADESEKEQIEGRDEAATTDVGKLSNVGVDLNITMAGGLPSTQLGMPATSDRFEDAVRRTDPKIGQPSGSEVGDRAASYESRGPSTRKRSLEEGGSTVDRPQGRMQHADSVEGTVIDRDGDEVNDGRQYSGGPSKRARDSDSFDAIQLSRRGDASCAGPSHSLSFEIDIEVNRVDPFRLENEQIAGLLPYTRDSARASSVIAMDTACHSADDSMESVENYPGDIDDVHFPRPNMYRNPGMNDVLELNLNNQAQQSTCLQPESGRVFREMGVSSIDDGEELLNAETATVNARGGFSFGVSGGSVGMGASHEAEIHGTDASVHGTESIVGEAEPIAEVTENQGQTGEFVPDPRLMDEFVPEEMDREDAHGDSQDMISLSIGRADSGSKIDGSAKAESVESGEKLSHALGHENSACPSLSCNAIIYSGYEVSKGEVTQTGKASLTDDCTHLESEYNAANGIGQANGENNVEVEAGEFDPLKHHHQFCPWVDGNVAAAGCCSEDGVSTGAIALCGWQLTLDALDAFQSTDHVPIQIVESESAASLYKDERLIPVQKLLGRRSVSKSHGWR